MAMLELAQMEQTTLGLFILRILHFIRIPSYSLVSPLQQIAAEPTNSQMHEWLRRTGLVPARPRRMAPNVPCEKPRPITEPQCGLK